jgi:NitT/TauT family transport system ATP-binding protein
LGLILENKLPYPRDTKSPEFQRLVDTIHETITTLALPDQPPEPPPAPGQPVSRARRRMESIPLVTLGQIIGLISILYDGPELANIYDISDEIEKDFGDTIAIVKAAEILELVDTPKNDVQLTALGRRFHEGSREERQKILSEQIYKLRLFHIILAYLEAGEEVDAERVLQDIAHALPYDNPEKVLQTMIAWGRYAGIMDYNPDSKTVFVPHDEENAIK